MAHANFEGQLPRAAWVSVDESRPQREHAIWDECDNCWIALPSPMDVPTLIQAVGRDCGAEVLRSLRQLASTAWPECAATTTTAFDDSGGAVAAAEYADWELLQDEMLTVTSFSVEGPLQPATAAQSDGSV